MRCSWLRVLVAFLITACSDPVAGPSDADVGDADLSEDGDPSDADVDDEVDSDHDVETDGDVPLPDPVRAARPLTQWVDPFIGTGGLGFGVGSAFPGPQLPFGFARPSPDTTGPDSSPGPTHCAGYSYHDVLIEGFSNTHPHGMGIPEYGGVGLMATVGMDTSKTSSRGYRSLFSHASEEASPGYYAVTLDSTDIRAELTATARVGLYRFTFPAQPEAIVLLDVGYTMADMDVIDGAIQIDSESQEISGFTHISGGYSGRFGGVPVYFVLRASRVADSYGVWRDEELFDGETSSDGVMSGAWLRFDASADQQVEVAVGLSFIDVDHARANLESESAEIDFDAARTAADAAWEEVLERVEIEGRSERDFEIFYSALYHSLLMPSLATDSDGSYRGLDGEVHTAEGFVYYTDFSLWDTFRSLHPLLTLLYPELQLDMLRSLMAMGRDGGYVPRWPLAFGYTGGMVGDSADIVFADSWAKGVRDFDLAEAYELLRRTAMGPTEAGSSYGGRGGIEEYLELGFVPIEASGASASRTLEFAYNDWALAILAEALGEEEDRAAFEERAGNWRNIWHGDSGFLLGRNRDGSFAEAVDDDPLSWREYWAEGNAWQYLWYAPHDLDGLAEAMGGREAFFGRLDQFFEESAAQEYFPILPGEWYWHGNEPDLHAPWIYAALDRPAETARWVRWAMERHYGDGPDGLAGNDDSGTLSAWYVFAASGLFPIAGRDDYLLSSPIFTRITMHLGEGDFIIEAPDASERALFIQSATLDDEPLERARIAHEDLLGSTLRFELGHTPSSWATLAP